MAPSHSDTTPTLVRKILITRFSALGDVAMTIPVVYSVCRANPSVEFVYLTRGAMTGMMVNPPANLRLHGIDPAAYRGVGGMRRLASELHSAYGHFDAMADLHNVLRTIILGTFLRLNGVKVCRLNKLRAHRRALTRRRNKIMLPMVSQRARFRQVFYRLGLNVDEHFSSLWPAEGAPAAAYAAICRPKAHGEVWIAVAPFAAHRGKVYPPELMHKVIMTLAERVPHVRIFLFGGGDSERATLTDWAAADSRLRSLAGERFGFAAELALLSHVDVMVSMDSANMHLASLVKVPVVAVWGATHPYCGFRGFRQSDATAVQLTMTCRPCSVFGNKPCHRGDYHCLAGIAPATIVDKVTEVIKNKKK